MDTEEKYICEQLLNNANLEMDYNVHNDSCKLEFTVWGSVKEKYFKVELHCNKIIHFNITYFETDQEEKEIRLSPFAILGCSIEKAFLKDTNWAKSCDTLNKDSIQNELFSKIHLEGDVTIDIVCHNHSVRVLEISKDEYLKSLPV